MNDFAKTIEDVALRLPSLPNIPRKNLFDILNIQRKETLNSKILAYFFDANEDHAYGDLFRNALLSTLKSKEVEIDQDFYSPLVRVVTEERTRLVQENDNRKKSIDIVLEGDGWCILIENKIDHTLNNPLEIYREHGQAKNKKLLCVVLSLNIFEQKPCCDFINITHLDLISEVRKEIPFDTSIPELDIFYLREYFKNIESHYFNLNNQPRMNDIIPALVLNSEAIIEIEDKKKKAIAFIDSERERVFKEFNYDASEVWFVHPQNHNLCFWISYAKDILETNTVSIYFEVWRELKDKTSEAEIKELINIKDISSCLYHDNYIDNQDKFRIAKFYEEDFIKAETNFGAKLKYILREFFFSPNGIEEQAITKLNLGLLTAKQCK